MPVSSRFCMLGLCVLLGACTVERRWASGEAAGPATAVLGAVAEEVTLLEGMLAEKVVHEVEGLRFVTGTLAGRRVVIGRTGVGKVNAGMVTGLLLSHFRLDEVLVVGVAGSLDPAVQPGDVVVATRTAQHDRGREVTDGFVVRGTQDPIEGDRNPIFFSTAASLLAAARAAEEHVPLEPAAPGRASQIVTGTVVTGDVFVASQAKKRALRRRFQAVAVEMEGAAVAQVCWQRDVPCLIVRGISDTAEAGAWQEIAAYMTPAANNAARLVAEIIRQIAAR